MKKKSDLRHSYKKDGTENHYHRNQLWKDKYHEPHPVDRHLQVKLPATIRQEANRPGKRGPLSDNANPDKEFKTYWKEIQETHNLTKERVSKLISKFMSYTLADIEVKMEDPNTKALEMMVLKVMEMAWRTGDYSRLNFLLERAVGKVSDKRESINHNIVYVTGVGPDGTLLQEIQKDEEQRLVGSTDQTYLPEGETIEGEISHGKAETSVQRKET